VCQRESSSRGPLARAVKRAFDVAVAAAGLTVLSPFLLAVAAAGMFLHGWPPLFAQQRHGFRGRVFTLYKFRTMTKARGSHGDLLADHERLTPFGRFLRSTSLDELPELVNVLRGDMSLVGPRPLLVQTQVPYNPRQARRHDVRPGITGWAQVHGRNRLGWEEKLEHDVWYVDHWSTWLDLWILARTLWIVLRREGVFAEGEATSQSRRP
jgi:sugar transferase EpsL